MAPTSTRPQTRTPRRALALALLLLLAACARTSPDSSASVPRPLAPPTPTLPRATPRPAARAPAASTTSMLGATLTAGLAPGQRPAAPLAGGELPAGQPLAVSIRIAGQPGSGVVAASLARGGETIARAAADLADPAAPRAPDGADTLVGLALAPASPPLVGERLRVTIEVDGRRAATYDVLVAPPPGAIATRVGAAALGVAPGDGPEISEGAPTFAPDAEVFLAGGGDFGRGSWLRADWYVAGQLPGDGSQLFGPLSDNLTGAGFSFSYRPHGGWPAGRHEVVLTADGAEVARYPFSIVGGEPPPDPVADEPDDSAGVSAAEGAGNVESADLTPYEGPGGTFTIAVPRGWGATDTSGAGAVSVAWEAPDQPAAVFVLLQRSEQRLTRTALVQQGADFVVGLFGEDPSFEPGEVEELEDGMLLPFAIAPDVGGEPLPLVGRAYVQQFGDKVSVLAVVYPAGEGEGLWADLAAQLVASYSVDPAAPLPE